MKRKTRSDAPVLGVTAPRARPTMAGAFWLAMMISLPVGGVICLIEILWRVLR